MLVLVFAVIENGAKWLLPQHLSHYMSTSSGRAESVFCSPQIPLDVRILFIKELALSPVSLALLPSRGGVK